MLPVPDLREQDAITALADASATRIRAEEGYRDKLQLLKQGLMQDLLTGRVRVPVSVGEPELAEVGA
jgi:type I restriction enzyme, S subunit